MFALYRFETKEDAMIQSLVNRKEYEYPDDVLRDCKQAIKEIDDNLIHSFVVEWEESSAKA